MATIPCSVVEYVHYSRAIEEKNILRRCHRSARLTYEKGFPPLFPPHNSLMHYLSNYLHFLA